MYFPADRGMAMAIPRMDLEDIHHVWANGRKMFTHQPQDIYTLIHFVYSQNKKKKKKTGNGFAVYINSNMFVFSAKILKTAKFSVRLIQS